MRTFLKLFSFFIILIPVISTAQVTATFTNDVNDGCSADTVFVQFSYTGSGATSWFWSFGDGRTSTDENPSIYYTNPGSYDITLIASAGADKDTLNQDDLITVNQSPSVGVICTNDRGCEQVHAANFESIIYFCNGTPSFSWDLDDGNTSTQSAFVHNYQDFGDYRPDITITDAVGCTVLRSTRVYTYPVVAEMAVASDSVCPNAVTSINTYGSSGGLTTMLDFGGGLTSYDIDTVFSFADPGSYQIKVLTIRDSVCKDSSYQTIYVENVVADFSVSPAYGCETTHSATYTDESTNANSWTWYFSDGTTSTDQNPTHTVVVNTGETENYLTDSLVITSDIGCTGRVTHDSSLFVHLLQPSISSDKWEGCIPLSVTFTDNSSPADTATSWLWEFGDGATSTDQRPVHDFTPDGYYQVTLTVANAEGCDTASVFTIRSGYPQNPVVDIVDDTVCAYGPLQLRDRSTDSLLTNGWVWKSVDPTFGLATTSRHVDLNELTNTGWMDIEFQVGYNGCYDTLLIPNAVWVDGAITSDIDTVFTCNDRMTRGFTATFQDTTSYMWCFGDGDTLWSYGTSGITPGLHGGRTVGTPEAPFHTYENPGSYLVELRGYENTSFPDSPDSCEYYSSYTLQIRKPIASFMTLVDSVCLGDTIFLDAGATEDGVSGFGSIYYNWNFNDGAADTSYNQAYLDMTPDRSGGPNHEPWHIFPDTGTYVIDLSIRDLLGCTHDTSLTVYIFGPEVQFVTTDTVHCFPFTDTLYDNTESDITIKNWTWTANGVTFSNGAVDSLTYTVPAPGRYVIQMVATDSLGCYSASSNIIYAVQPSVSFTIEDSTLCVGQTVAFTDSSVNWSSDSYSYGLETWEWTFGNDDTVFTQNANYAFPDSGSYYATLYVQDSLGCDSTYTDSTLLHVQPTPQVGFATDNNYFCYPGFVNFSDTTVSDYISTYEWYLGYTDSTLLSLPSISYQYESPDSLDIGLKITTTYGCTDSVLLSDYLVVHGATAEFNTPPDTICKYVPVNFNLVNPVSVASVLWDFGDGITAPGDSVQHEYAVDGSVLPLVMLTSPEGCVHSYYSDSVHMSEIAATFSFANNEGCMPVYNMFYSTVLFAHNYGHWDFGDGTPIDTTGAMSLPHTYTEAGTYTVSYAIESSIGCIDTAFSSIIVHPIPEVTVSSDTVLCKGDDYIIEAFAPEGSSFGFDPEINIFHIDTNKARVWPDSSQSYNVTAIDTNGCSETAYIQVDILKIPYASVMEDTLLYIGEDVQVFGWVDSTEAYTFRWEPTIGLNCDTCLDPMFRSEEDGHFTLWVSDVDSLCRVDSASVYITVVDTASANIANAFTPNGDGSNDMVMVKGWGIEKLISFRVFNRWGEMVFENLSDDPNDILNAWDGTIDGVPQNADTYVCMFQVQWYGGKIGEPVKGYIHLVR